MKILPTYSWFHAKPTDTYTVFLFKDEYSFERDLQYSFPPEQHIEDVKVGRLIRRTK